MVTVPQHHTLNTLETILYALYLKVLQHGSANMVLIYKPDIFVKC